MAFVIKEGDTLPNLPFQLFEPDGVTPLDLSGATVVNMAVRRTGGGAGVTFKKPCTITDAVIGEGIYDWVAADTFSPGQYEYEFEITWSNGDIQTIPADGYFSLVIVDDIG